MNSVFAAMQYRRVMPALVGALISVLLIAVPAFSQVPDPAFNEPSDSGYTGSSPVTQNPVTTPNLANLNENADIVQYIDRELGPVNVGFDLKAGHSDNLFNAPGKAAAGSFAGFGIPAGLRLRGENTQFDLNYRLDKNYYPSYSQADNISQVYSHQLEHHSSEHTAYFWNAAAGRLTSINQFLPSFVAIGSTGVALAPVGSSVLENTYTTTDLATSLGFSHAVSERDNVLGTATAGFVEQAQAKAAPGSPRQVLRNDLGGLDLRYERATSDQSKIGAELTNVYIRGLAPLGHENYIAAEGTYQRHLNDNLDMRVAAGPLYSSVSDASTGRDNSFTYAASANLEYRIEHTRMVLGYSRVLELQYVQSATTANQLSGVLDRELSPTVDITVGARYVRSDSSSQALNQSLFGLDGRIDKRIAPDVLLFISASRSQQQTPVVFGNNDSFNRDDVFAGVTVLFGNPIYRRGVH